MAATSTPTGVCSFLLNLAQHSMLSTHHHGRCGGADYELLSRRAPRPQYGPSAASRHVNGGRKRDHDVGRASSESGLRKRPSAQTVTWYVRPPPCSLAALSRLGMRWWAGRASRHSLLQPSRASLGRGRLGRARARRDLHTHQAARAVRPVKSLRDVWRASVLMKLSPAVRRCREEPPEAARRRLPWPAAATRGEAAHCAVFPRSTTTRGMTRGPL